MLDVPPNTVKNIVNKRRKWSPTVTFPKTRTTIQHLPTGMTQSYQGGCQETETTLTELREHLASTEYSLHIVSYSPTLQNMG